MIGERTFGAVGPNRRVASTSGCAYCIDGFNGTARYQIDDGGPAGSATMSRVTVVRLDALPAVIEEIQNRVLVGSARGWSVLVQPAAPRLQGRIFNGVGVNTLSPAYNFVAGEIGRVFVFFHTLDGVVLQLFKAFHGNSGVVTEIGAPGTVAVGYTPPAATDDFAIGGRGGGTNPALSLCVLACGGADATAWTTVQMQAILDDIRANCGRIEAALPGETFVFNADDVVPPAAWVGDSGGTATLQGVDQALVVRARFAPVFT